MILGLWSFLRYEAKEYWKLGWFWSQLREEIYWATVGDFLSNAHAFFRWGWRCRKIRGWDWTFLLKIMEYQLQDIEDNLKLNRHTCSKHELKHVKTCRNLCRRIREDTAYDDEELGFTEKRYQRRLMREKQDMELLFKLMCKHLKQWWS